MKVVELEAAYCVRAVQSARRAGLPRAADLLFLRSGREAQQETMKSPEEKSSATPARRRLLVVDDEAPIRGVLKSFLEKLGYQVTTAATGAEALKALKGALVELVILDVLLRDEDGLDLLMKLKKACPHRPVIIITGLYADDELKRRAYDKGASDCVSKMSPLDQLRTSVASVLAAVSPEALAAIEAGANRPARRATAARACALPKASALQPAAPAPKRSLSVKPASSGPPSEAKLPAPTSDAVQAPSRDSAKAPPTPAAEASGVQSQDAVGPPAEPGPIARLISVTEEAAHYEFGIEVFLRMLAANHPNLGNAAMRSVVLCDSLANFLRMPANQRQNFLWAAALHDISLIQIDRGLLSRWLRGPEKCAKDEIALIKQHPARAQRMLEFCPAFKEAAEIIRAHHENWDGTGYPDGHRMEMIPWLARLLTVVIFYCGKHRPNEKTLAEIEAQSNRLYDPQAVQAMLRVAPTVTLPRGEREIMAFELRSGMVLAGDINNWDGVLIVGKGKELSHATINRIVHLSEEGQIERRVLVYG